jgi:hypothetical protein
MTLIIIPPPEDLRQMQEVTAEIVCLTQSSVAGTPVSDSAWQRMLIRKKYFFMTMSS